MNTIRSRPTRGAAPLDRAILDSAASPVRVAFGALFLGWSWVSTVIIIGGTLALAFPTAHIPGVPDSYVGGLAFALLVTAIEFVSAGRWPVVYALFLLALDAPFTAYQTYDWLTTIAERLVKAAAAPGTAPELSVGLVVGIGLFAVICGIVAGIFGEMLLFGRRD